MTDKLLTPQDVAERLQIKVDTLNKWRYLQKGLTFVRIADGVIRYKESDVHDFIKKNTVEIQQ
jgi:predicted site-specific integrase-resolvase